MARNGRFPLPFNMMILKSRQPAGHAARLWRPAARVWAFAARQRGWTAGLPALLPALLLSTAVATAQGTAEPLPPNPFGVFESFRLPNGLKVWYGHMQGATQTSMAVLVPYGRDQDPPGREQTAHFLEHVLLSDRGGRSESELVRDLTSRGGTYAGITGTHYTIFPVNIDNEHAAWGVQWLHGVVAPRPFSEDVANRNRDPIAVELDLRRSTLLRGVVARLVYHPRLRPPGYWRREFGYVAQEERGADQLSGLAAVTADDLSAFYDTYYSSATMTLVIVSGRPRAELQPVIEETFGTLPWRPGPAPSSPLRLRQEETRRFTWQPSGSSRITVRYRIGELDSRDHLRLLFMEDLLRERLMQRLRSSEVKAVYSVGVFTQLRGPAAHFAVIADMNPRHEARVRDAIDEELERLRTAAGDSAFYADRDAIGRALRIQHASPGALRNWAADRLYRAELHEVFPDAGEYFATVGPDSIAAYARRLFTADNRILGVTRPVPLHPSWLVLLAGMVVVAGAGLYRRLALQPADMTAIRFIARLHRPAAVRIATLLAAFVGGLVVLRMLAAAAHFAVEYWLLPAGSFVLLAATSAALLFAATLGCMACAGMVQRKVLVFNDEVRIKSPTYRATIIPAARVRGARVVEGRQSLRLRRPVPGPVAGAVFLELADGTGYLLHVRDGPALVAAIDGLLQRQSAAFPAVEVTDQVVDGEDLAPAVAGVTEHDG
jgi:predicted Zn-dependent peptidase